MRVEQTRRFEKTVKKLHKNQKKVLDAAIREIMENPVIGEEKKGDLSGIRVHKFYMLKTLMLLAYTHAGNALTLLALGSHENFYRDLKQ